MANYLSKNLKKLAKSSKTLSKKIPGGLNTVLTGLDIIENTTKLAKPYIDDAVEAKKELNKRIYVSRIKKHHLVQLFIKDTGVLVHAETDAHAIEKLFEELRDFQKHKIISQDRKMQKAQLSLLAQLEAIENGEGSLSDYIIRIDLETEGSHEKSSQEAKSSTRQPFKEGLFVDQIEHTGKCLIQSKALGIAVEAQDQNTAYEQFLEALDALLEHKVLSEKGRVRKNQLEFIKWVQAVNGENLDYQDFIFRVRKSKRNLWGGK